ncbi:phosphatidylglycerophosphate synthase [Trypanosoma grayi]|uniref:phosphatidylglycerophosphate synthase n=1 Tax=Trypanosoma grayi TaxID=71804 RepID=UPI0004F4BDCC|nr:phosphatidylglycerophosphate synthase [Trypanosoma grayi]KEG08748.1 phosphatidylglycerophosphate synthase [Trypanosoma grayi]
MTLLAAYLVVLAVAALLTLSAFGHPAAAAALARGCGLDFFFPTAHASRAKVPPLDTLQSPLHAQQAEMLAFLQQTCCTLPVRAETVRILTRPTEFYEELRKRVRAARRSIVMSALYIGDGPLSTEFVACLENRVSEAVRDGQRLDICILLDHNRMHDRRNLLTLKQLLTLAHSTESATALDNNINNSSGNNGGDADSDASGPAVQVRLCLFQSPCRWNRLASPFGRAKEALGVQHTKIFCFDGRDTILSGANLSDDYFATRMDRYVVIEDNAYVAAWFSDLVHTLCSMSHRVVCRKAFASQGGSGRKPTLHKKSDLVILPNTMGIDPSAESAAFSVQANHLLQEFAARAVKAAAAIPNDKSYDTYLFPTLQCARANVFHDSLVVQRLLHMAPASTHIYLTSPYLNMYARFVDELLASRSAYDFITASVHTNGWRGARGFAGYIPFFYLQLERAFFYLMREYGCADRVRVREFSVDGLTFHAKGLWFVEREDGGAAAGGKDHISNGNGCTNSKSEEGEVWGYVKAPYLVAYGSTNYGYRSVHKDVEAEVFLFTTNTSLREALRDELVFLLRQSTLVTEERFVHGAQGRFQPVVSLLAQMGQDFL